MQANDLPRGNTHNAHHAFWVLVACADDIAPGIRLSQAAECGDPEKSSGKKVVVFQLTQKNVSERAAADLAAEPVLVSHTKLHRDTCSTHSCASVHSSGLFNRPVYRLGPMWDVERRPFDSRPALTTLMT